MNSVQELTDYLNTHHLIDFKMPVVNSTNETFRPKKSGLDISFSTMPETYASGIYGGFLTAPTTNTTTTATTTGTTKDDIKNQDPEEVRFSPSEKIREFGQATSMHGLSQAMGDRPLWRRLVWAVLVIGFATWATYNAIQIISDFQGHPVMTSVSSEYNGKVQFPAVTFCNLNRVRLSSAPDSVMRLADYLFAQSTDDIFINMMINLYMRVFSSDYQREMGHQLDSMLFHCRFATEYCTADNFTHTYNLHYGNCYTFASRHFPQRQEWSAQGAGPAHGLTLELDIQYGEYIHTSPAAGVKVVIHDNGEVPFPEDGGVVAGTGLYTSIGLRKSLTKRLSYPYGDCIHGVDKTNIHKNLYAQDGFTYSLNACLKSCFQENVYRHCNCCDSSYPCPSSDLQHSTGVEAPGGTIPLCNISISSTVDCINRITFEFADNKFGCAQSCPPPCQESSFSTSVSIAKWPAYHYWGTVLASRDFQGDINDYIRESEKTFLKIDVYFDNLIVEHVESQPAYSWNKVLGDIGGQLGLMLGFSILTAVEILELLVVDLGMAMGVTALWRRRHRTKHSSVDVKQAWDSSV